MNRITITENRQIQPNYIVTTNGFQGKQVFECDTEKDVWWAIGKDWSYEVESPTGKDVTDFIPF